MIPSKIETEGPGVLHLQPRPHDGEETAADDAELRISGISAWYGRHRAIADIDLAIAGNSVTALIGPSGCGKSTLLRCINRMHELTPGGRVEGSILFQGRDLYARDTPATAVREAIGMVFQRPNPFPTMSVYDNVVAGVRFQRGRVRRTELDDVAERALTQAGLWREVKTRLSDAATALSGGQQQRLCIARAIATEPSVVLMDEPCSALDPVATAAIEQLIRELRSNYTVVIVTHNLQQASRIADDTAFMTIKGEGEPGRLVEAGPTLRLFHAPQDPATEAYVTGKVG